MRSSVARSSSSSMGLKAPLDIDSDARVDAAIHTFDQIQIPKLILAHPGGLEGLLMFGMAYATGRDQAEKASHQAFPAVSKD